ncbi:STAS domain-containing protein [Streptomyces sp. BE20]|uniref:STAS domain-containing protein n=1 Tax=Streptomyces sp. BE20 TaxID=3002525 RepID=UPI002E774ED9|nr:STAS domain-containing protein [Streptomyces sp. BE20]MEE1828530.1 STAS domain-containing protein [Streptomyces sp. BE20]
MSGPTASHPDAGGAGGARLRVTTSEHAVKTLVCRIEGEVDHESRHVLDESLSSAVAAGPVLLVVDLAPLTFVDSACLNALLRIRQEAEEAGTRLVLAGPGPQMQRLLAVTGTDEVFTVWPSVHAVPGLGAP